MKYIIYIMNIVLLVSIPTVLLTNKVEKDEYSIVTNNTIKQLKSEKIKINVIKTVNNEQEEIKEQPQDNDEEVIAMKKETEEKDEEKVEQEEQTTDVLETLTGKMSGYGPDCSGCSGYLSSGRFVGNGNIYYEDKTYGNVRIVAGDYKYKLGSIVRIKNSRVSSDPFLAIVLDRGGSIGIDKKYMFDLLFESEQIALQYEVSDNTTFEILRNGY